MARTDWVAGEQVTHTAMNSIGTDINTNATNISGLTVGSLVPSTTAPVGVGTIELGHASDTTISRTGAGAIAVENVGVALNSISLTHTASTLELGHASDTTITRTAAGAIAVEGIEVTRRDSATTTSSATPTPAVTAPNFHYTVTALAAGATFGAPTGSPADGWKLVIRVKDNGTARALAYNAIYRALGVTLPTTTVISKTLYLGCIYNSADAKWDVVAVAQEA